MSASAFAIEQGLAQRIERCLVGLKMPRALEILQATIARTERGELGTLEAIELLLSEEYTLRESRRIKMALQTARLGTIKTLAGYDFSFQPSLDRNRVMALAQLEFIGRKQCVHLLGPPGPGKSHLAVALGVVPVLLGNTTPLGFGSSQPGNNRRISMAASDKGRNWLRCFPFVVLTLGLNQTRFSRSKCSHRMAQTSSRLEAVRSVKRSATGRNSLSGMFRSLPILGAGQVSKGTMTLNSASVRIRSLSPVIVGSSIAGS